MIAGGGGAFGVSHVLSLVTAKWVDERYVRYRVLHTDSAPGVPPEAFRYTKRCQQNTHLCEDTTVNIGIHLVANKNKIPTFMHPVVLPNGSRHHWHPIACKAKSQQISPCLIAT